MEFFLIPKLCETNSRSKLQMSNIPCVIEKHCQYFSVTRSFNIYLITQLMHKQKEKPSSYDYNSPL